MIKINAKLIKLKLFIKILIKKLYSTSFVLLKKFKKNCRKEKTTNSKNPNIIIKNIIKINLFFCSRFNKFNILSINYIVNYLRTIK